MIRSNKEKKNAWVKSRSRYGTLEDGRFRINPRCYAWHSHPGSLTVWLKRGGGFFCHADSFYKSIKDFLRFHSAEEVYKINFNY